MEENTTVSATEPDWSREQIKRFWDPGPRLMRSIRQYQAARASGGVFGRLMSKYWVLSHRFWSLMTQSELHLNMRIAGGLLMPHPTGIIAHPEAVLGPNCLLMHQVTLSGPVHLGGHVDIGTGAKLLGQITIGDHVEVGANAVVTKDVPAGAVVAGVPARIIRMKPGFSQP